MNHENLPSIVNAALPYESAKTALADRTHVREVRRKRLFIETARLSFVKSEREHCAVCEKYKGLAQAHHVVPLSLQFDRGRSYPDHKHIWLCPTHHVAVHQEILRNATPWEFLSEVALDCADELTGHGEYKKILEIADMAR